MIERVLFLLLFFSILSSCHQTGAKKHVVTKPVLTKIQQAEWQQALKLKYHLVPAGKHPLQNPVAGLDSAHLQIILALNRIDSVHIALVDTLVMPDTLLSGLEYYAPFPATVNSLDSVPKLIFYSYTIEAFAAYEYGRLVRWGPVSMGKESTPTPTGLFFTNWKAEKNISSFNDEWKMNWYFNLRNFSGVSMHEYEMPGVPASHACVRLLAPDAIYFYHWCDQWILNPGKNGTIAAYGTPVIIFGSWNFGERKPWLALAENSKATDISETELDGQVNQFLPVITERRITRDSIMQAREVSKEQP